MEQTYKVTDDIDVLTSYFPIPGMGMIPVNAFVLKAKEPILVDTGLVVDSDAFVEALGSIIDLQDLKWLWLTHADQDHVGSLHRLLAEVPHLKLVTSFLGMGKLALSTPVAPDRVYLINPGQTLDLGDRSVVAVKPPAYDAPETTGCYDPRSGAFFSSDCFGAILESPVQDAADLNAEYLNERQVLWATVDSPWILQVKETLLDRALDSIREMSPKMVLSNHLPPAQGMTEQLLSVLEHARVADPFVGPDQEAFQMMLAQMT
jgi:flavorubredoxin